MRRVGNFTVRNAANKLKLACNDPTRNVPVNLLISRLLTLFPLWQRTYVGKCAEGIRPSEEELSQATQFYLPSAAPILALVDCDWRGSVSLAASVEI
jgi:hypothetical protein